MQLLRILLRYSSCSNSPRSSSHWNNNDMHTSWSYYLILSFYSTSLWRFGQQKLSQTIKNLKARLTKKNLLTISCNQEYSKLLTLKHTIMLHFCLLAWMQKLLKLLHEDFSQFLSFLFSIQWSYDNKNYEGNKNL